MYTGDQAARLKGKNLDLVSVNEALEFIANELAWNGKIYFDPFGLKSSCSIWAEYATAAEWLEKYH